jgi:antitoxin FitA
MSNVLIRNLPEETHRALKQRAKTHGRSTEAEIREILTQAVNPPERLKLGSAIHALAMKAGGMELDIPPRTDMPRIITFE